MPMIIGIAGGDASSVADSRGNWVIDNGEEEVVIVESLAKLVSPWAFDGCAVEELCGTRGCLGIAEVFVKLEVLEESGGVFGKRCLWIVGILSDSGPSWRRRQYLSSVMSNTTQPLMYREAIEWMQGIRDPFCCSTWAYTGSPYRGENWEPPHSKWSTVLWCINEKKIGIGPPSDKQIAIAALDKATWMIHIDMGGMATRYTYIVPSNTQDGYLMEVCRGGLTDLSGTSSALSCFRKEFQDHVRIFPRRKKHGNEWKCWFYER
ncbi:hypothetical protein BDZ45DRAFT_693483 [Acephala macrosclerotiorum]|nr:hypothetical protein BDZ45DRAFT_693483 [Acephala macrosclerotiorum]